MYVLTIHKKETEGRVAAPARRRAAPPKTRAFAALPLAWITGRELWPDPRVKTESIRPLWIMLTAGDEAALRPFIANLRAGRLADLTDTQQPGHAGSKTPPRIELLKSAGYNYLWQRNTGPDRAAVVTAYLSTLCALDPGLIDPTEIRFLCLAPGWWCVQEATTLRTDRVRCAAVLAHTHRLGLHETQRPAASRRLPVPLTLSEDALLDLVPQAAYFAAYLDRRTGRPLVNDLGFFVQIYLAALASGIASLAQTPQSLRRHRDGGYRASDPDPADPWGWARQPAYRDFQEVNTRAVGLVPGIACRTDHATLDAFLAAEVARYLQAQDDQYADPAAA